MNNDDIKLTFAKDEIKDDYKRGKSLAPAAIGSDAPLGPVKPKRTKLKLFSLALILGYGYFESLNMGVAGYWIGLASGLVCAAVVLVARFNRVSKRYARQSQESHLEGLA